MDWGTGQYERTARALEPASAVAVDALRPHPGDRVLDVACGTGNAALLAAGRGATVAGVDASPRLIDVASQRARADGVDGDWRVADLAELPFGDGVFDSAISVFGVIFAEDASRAVSEIRRVVKPRGTIVLTAWVDAGPIVAVMAAVSRAVAEEHPDEQGRRTWLAWSDYGELRSLFGEQVEITSHELPFDGSSPGAWVLEQASFHPGWLEVGAALSSDRFERLLDEATSILSAANEDPDGMRVSSPYLVARARA